MADATDKDTLDEEHSKLINDFVQITGTDPQDARDNLEWSLWDIGMALERYYGRMEVRTPVADDAIDSDEPEIVEEIQSDPDQRRTKKDDRMRFGTIAGLKTTDTPDSSDEDDGQAYYAGGSQHSGQQVLGPPQRKKKKDIIADILKSVQQIGAEVVDPNKPSTSSGIRPSFSGTGYRLGQTETDSQVIPSTSRTPEETRTVILKLWKEGFNVDDGPLRAYEDPDNKQFLDSVRQGLIPPELTDGGTTFVNLRMEDRHHRTYEPSDAPRVTPFSGQGHVLGRPTPVIQAGAAEAAGAGAADPVEYAHDGGDDDQTQGPQAPFVLDESLPTTTIAIRLPDGRRLHGVFNYLHTVADIRNYIQQTHPEFASRHYTLQTTIPISELDNYNVTIEEAGLINSVLIMKIRK